MKDEHGTSFDCFGGTCAAYVIGDARAGRGRRTCSGACSPGTTQFTRFDPASELSRLNADRRDASR